MTDTPASLSSPSDPQLPGEPPHHGKKVIGLIIAVIVILAVAVAAFYLCPRLSPQAPATSPNTAQIEARMADIDHRVQALENRFQELSSRVASPIIASTDKPVSTTNAVDVARMQSDLVSLSSALSALQTEVKQNSTAAAQAREATQTLLAGAISFIQLRDAALSGHGFTTELAAFHAAAGGDAVLQKFAARLEPYAAQGSPSFSELREELIAHEAEAVNNIEKSRAQNWWQRIVAELKGLISVRPLHGNDVSDGFAAVENALDRSDAAGALDAYKNLAPEAQQSLGDWHTRLEARATIDDTLNALALHFTGGAASSPMQDTP